MSASRTSQLTHLHKVLKRHYKPVSPDPKRPVLEHLLFACCLEDAHYDAAEEAFAVLVHTFFDFNEIRVTSLVELAEVLSRLPDPRAAADRIKRVLQSVFEATYSFDLEEKRKEKLGSTARWLADLDGTTRFCVAYVVQSALGGHAIPVGQGALRALRLVELVADKDVEAGVVPGLERAIPKSKGISFGSMLHQLGADFIANPYATSVQKTLLEINPEAKDRLPKRRVRKEPSQEEAEPQEPAKKGKGGKKRGASEGRERRKRRKRPAGESKRSPPGKKTPRAGDSSEKRKASGKSSTGKKKSAAAKLAKRKPR